MRCECCEKNGAGCWQAEYDAGDDGAREQVGQFEAQATDEGVDGDAYAVFDDDFAFFEALGAPGLNVLLAEYVEQVAAHDADDARCAARADDDDGYPDMFEEIDEFCPRPGSADVFGREEAAYGFGFEDGDLYEHDDQGQQKIWGGQADESEKGKAVIAYRILSGGRVDANGYGDDPGEDQCGECEGEGESQALGQEFHHVHFVREGLPEVAFADDFPDPVDVLHIDRIVEAIAFAQGIDLRHRAFRSEFALFGQFGEARGEHVARRRLNDHKADH